MEYVWIMCVFFVCCVVTCNEASPVMLEAVEWKNSRRLYDYRLYAAILLERVELPPHTVSVNLTLMAFSDHGSCRTRKVHVFCNQYGIPVVSRDGEVFPNDTYTPKMVSNMTMSTNREKSSWVLSSLSEGSLFVMGIMPHDDKRIRQKGLYRECQYYLTMQAVIQYFAEDSISFLRILGSNRYLLEGGTTKLIGFKVPPDTSSYDLEISGCRTESCNLTVFVWESLIPGMWTSRENICTLKDGSCDIKKTSPHLVGFNYVGLSLISKTNQSIDVSLKLHSCTYHNATALAKDSERGLTDKTMCVLNLGRETPSGVRDDTSFHDRFTVWDEKSEKPSKKVSVDVSDDVAYGMSFTLRDSDTGGTLNIDLYKPGVSNHKSKTKQKVEVTMCAMLWRIVPSGNCSDGMTLKMDSASDKKKVTVMIPYPQTGTWYLSLNSRCFPEGENQSSSVSVKCDDTPQANLTIELSSCINNRCGAHGQCRLYSGAGIVYKACDCFGGWRGYGCNDGSKAEGLSIQKIAVYLLTFSNLGFIPGICLALYRRHFVEAFVYAFNMFFSTFYHACDSSRVYKLCIMSFGALSFADFFASLMSFAVTLLAMARLPISVRAFLHVVAAMFIAVGEVYNRHGLFEQLMPIALGLAIVVFTWGYEIYKRKSLFPSKKRYLKFIIPGLAFASVGLSLNLAVETDDNYKYIHSVWHMLVSGAIVFLLPPRRGKKSPQPLSIQSGDVMGSHQGLVMDNEPMASIQNANEPDPPPQLSDATSHNNGIMLTNRIQRSRSNYII